VVLPVQDLLASSSPDGVAELLARDVEFHSPVADYSGRNDVAHLFATIGRVLTDVQEVHTYGDGARSASTFTGLVGERVVDGVLTQRLDSRERLEEATLLLRPYSALRDAAAQMRAALAADPLPSQR